MVSVALLTSLRLADVKACLHGITRLERRDWSSLPSPFCHLCLHLSNRTRNWECRVAELVRSTPLPLRLHFLIICAQYL